MKIEMDKDFRGNAYIRKMAIDGLGHIPQQAKSHQVYTDALLANL
jgi:hypothetical protein